MEYVGMYCKKRQEKHKRAIKQSTSLRNLEKRFVISSKIYT